MTLRTATSNSVIPNVQKSVTVLIKFDVDFLIITYRRQTIKSPPSTIIIIIIIVRHQDLDGSTSSASSSISELKAINH